MYFIIALSGRMPDRAVPRLLCGMSQVGDTLTLTLVASRIIYQPTVRIGGVPVTPRAPGGDSNNAAASFTGSQWIAERVVAAGEPDGRLSVRVSFEDLFGNRRERTTLSAGSLNVSVDATPPSVVLSAADGMPAPGGVFGPLSLSRLFMFATFSEPVGELDAAALGVSSGEVAGLSQVNETAWRFEVAGVRQGTLGVALLAGAAADNAGNPSWAAEPWGATYDATPPAVSMTYDPAPAWAFHLNATDDVSSVAQLLCRLYAAGAAAPPAFSRCATPYAVNATGAFRLGQSLTFELSAVDAAGNIAPPWSYTFDYDATTGPVEQPFAPTPPPTPAPTPAPTTAAPTPAPTPAPTLAAPTPAPTPAPPSPPPPSPPVFTFSTPGGRAAEGNTSFQVTLGLSGLDLASWGVYVEQQVVASVALLTDVAPARVRVVQKFAVAALSASRALLQSRGSSGTSVLLEVSGWADDVAAQEGITDLAGHVAAGHLAAELGRRSVPVSGVTYSAVRILNGPAGGSALPSAPLGTQPPAATPPAPPSLMSDPAVVGVIAAAAVVILLSVIVLAVVLVKRARSQEQTVAPKAREAFTGRLEGGPPADGGQHDQPSPTAQPPPAAA